jgi:hypothetical protein
MAALILAHLNLRPSLQTKELSKALSAAACRKPQKKLC